MSSTVVSYGMFTVLEIAPEMNGCTAPIMRDVPHVRDRALADGDVEHRQVLVGEARRADDRAVLGDECLDLLDLRRRSSRASSERAARSG